MHLSLKTYLLCTILYVKILNIRERDTLVVDHSRAGLHKVMKELELDGTATSNQVYKVMNRVCNLHIFSVKRQIIRLHDEIRFKDELCNYKVKNCTVDISSDTNNVIIISFLRRLQ